MTFVISDALHGHLVRQGTIRDGWTMISATSKTDRSGANSRRWLALWVLCAGFLLVAVDMTIVNVALPSIGHDLGFSQSGLAWVVDAYLIAYGGCLLLAGRLGDLWGRNRIFVAGLTTFSAASLLCAVSNSQSMLIGARMLQGIGGAGSSAVILGMVTTLFPEVRERSRAIGVFTVVSSAGSGIGMIAGGVITQAVNWHWIFLVNVPLGLVTVLCARRWLAPEREPRPRSGADVIGAVLITGGLMSAIYTVVQSPDFGRMSWRTEASGAVALTLLSGFVARQATARHPLLPLELFRSRMLSLANVIQGALTAAIVGFFFLGTLDFERVLGYGPMSIGLAFLPEALATGMLSLSSAQLVRRFGPQAVLLAGEAVSAVALALLALGPIDSSYATDLLAPIILLGFGGALLFPPLVMLAMADVEPRGAGVASGLLNTSGQIGGALGLSLMAMLSTWHTSSLRRGGESSASVALGAGYHFAWTIGVVIVLATIALTVYALRAPNRAPASPPDEVAVGA